MSKANVDSILDLLIDLMLLGGARDIEGMTDNIYIYM